MLLRFSVVTELYCVFWQVEQPILLFVLIIVLLLLMLLSLGQMLLKAHFIYFVIMAHDVIEPCGCQGSQGPGW